MSEYQYYEFQAIDRPLTDGERRELRALSTRAEITPTSFSNEYHWGDFKGNPDRLMEKYFDAFLYYANWGTRRLMFRLPARLFDVEQASPYCLGEGASVREAGEFVILEFLLSPEDGADDWEEGYSLASLIPLRADLLHGDLRALYLGWLLCAQMLELEDEEPEPPVPPGLGDLTGALQSLVEFLGIDEDLIAAAAERSAESAPLGPSRQEWQEWIRRLPDDEKDALLLRVAEGQAAHLQAELWQRFQRDRRSEEAAGEAASAASASRTVAELLAAAEERAEERKRKEAARQAAEKARREREEAAARAAYLDRLRGREPALWREVEALIATKQPKKYDQAVGLLRDLRDLSARGNGAPEFGERIQELRARHATKPSLIDRLNRAGVGTTGKGS